MLEYIKKQLAERVADQEFVSSRDDRDTDEAIVEYAHLFQELDELSVKGTDDGKDRPMGIDIPLEDDIELESIEMNITDGRVTDIPVDATVQEYLVMKTYDDFYQEAYDSTMKMPREEDDAFASRVAKKAQDKFSEYKNEVVKKGLFGFGRINIDKDSRIPSDVVINLGPIDSKSGKEFITKLPVYWKTDNKGRIAKKQLESLEYLVINHDGFATVAPHLVEIVKEKITAMPKNVRKEAKNITTDTLWKIITPDRLLIPEDPIDSYIVTLICNGDIYDDSVGDPTLFAISAVRQIKTIHDRKFAADMKVVDPATFKGFKSKREVLKESYEMNAPVRDGFAFFQEAIDFGEGDETTPPEGSSTADMGDAAPTVSGGNANPGEDTETADTAAAEDKVQVDTNDVSDQIVDKVASATSSDDDDNAELEPTEPEVDTDELSDDTDDTEKQDDSDNKDIDSQLDDLDDTSADTTSDVSDNASDINIDNMTIDELLKQGSEKLKGMTINQLKSFIADGGEATESVQEAFFLTAKNINTEIDLHLRNALGILNSDELELEKLIDDFKSEGKKLNRVLGKASKMKKVYNQDEMKEIGNLNKCLIDLMTTLRMSKDQNYVATVKRLIQAFTSQSKVVAQIVEAKLPKKNKPVTESYDIDDLYNDLFQNK